MFVRGGCGDIRKADVAFKSVDGRTRTVDLRVTRLRLSDLLLLASAAVLPAFYLGFGRRLQRATNYGGPTSLGPY